MTSVAVITWLKFKQPINEFLEEATKSPVESENSLWVEKYRLKDLSDYIGNEPLKKRLHLGLSPKTFLICFCMAKQALVKQL